MPEETDPPGHIPETPLSDTKGESSIEAISEEPEVHRENEAEVAEEAGELVVEETVERPSEMLSPPEAPRAVTASRENTEEDRLPSFIPGDTVRVRRSHGSPEDDWQYESTEEGRVTVSRFNPVTGRIDTRTIPSDAFYDWQNEKAVEKEVPPKELPSATGKSEAGEPPEEPPHTAEGTPDEDLEPEPDREDEEIPSAILTAAAVIKINEGVLRTMHGVLKSADWTDTLDFLRAAQKDEELRNHVRRFHGIDLEAPGADHTFADIPLKKVLEVAPDEWAAERARRQQERKTELWAMLKKFDEFIPPEMPLSSNVEVPPDMFMPDDPEGAYGVWRRLKIQEYEKRIRAGAKYPVIVEDIRDEIKRIGGPLPGLRRIGKWVLAMKILQTEKKEARATRRDVNFGALGIGVHSLQHIVHNLSKYDEAAKDARRALSRKNRSTYTKDGQGTPRRHLAEKIVTLRQQGLAHQKGHLDPRIPRKTDAPTAWVDSGSREMVT